MEGRRTQSTRTVLSSLQEIKQMWQEVGTGRAHSHTNPSTLKGVAGVGYPGGTQREAFSKIAWMEKGYRKATA